MNYKNIHVDEYANKNDSSPEFIIKQIKEGLLKGHITNDSWYVEIIDEPLADKYNQKLVKELASCNPPGLSKLLYVLAIILFIGFFIYSIRIWPSHQTNNIYIYYPSILNVFIGTTGFALLSAVGLGLEYLKAIKLK